MSRFNKPITGKKNNDGRMQVEVFPQRVLNLETAQQLIDGLNGIEGITRMVVFGPHRPREDPDDLLDGKFAPTDNKYLNIKGEKVELTVQVGRIWIEIEGESVVEKIRAVAEKALPFPFEMYEGLYIRSQQTVVDYAKGVKTGDKNLGLFDPKDRRGHTSCCGSKSPEKRVKTS